MWGRGFDTARRTSSHSPEHAGNHAKRRIGRRPRQQPKPSVHTLARGGPQRGYDFDC